MPPRATPGLSPRTDTSSGPSLLEQFGWIMLYFAGVYAAVITLMALVGVILASRTRGAKALHLLAKQPNGLVLEGQVVRTSGESWLAKLYMLALAISLVLFYFATPFVIAGLLAWTAALVLLLAMCRILHVGLLAAGLQMTWAVLKSLFAGTDRGSFGIPKTAADCPRLHEIVSDVARRVDTSSVDEIYLAPGSAIGVHQEGRGPFGMFGGKRRVLTLGMSTMHFLTVGELRAILAHEYAHFSHGETFYGRFIYQVTLSITASLQGMAQAGGYFNYINPFFWFLFLYYKAYNLLSAGFSRSREFLADRMACSLYGSEAFASGLTKVATDGTLFEMTVYQNIHGLLEQGQAFVNMYGAFRSFRNEQLSKQARDKLYRDLLAEEGSLSASHPTFRERIEAFEGLAKAQTADATPALSLFDNSEEIEKELTEFLTGFMYHMQQMQGQYAEETQE